MRFEITTPCPNCPFRTDDGAIRLRAERAREIAQDLDQCTFTCHKTTVPDPNNGAEMMDGPNAQHCAGALIMLEREGAPSQMMRIAERLGIYDPQALKMDAPVFLNRQEFITEHARSERACRELDELSRERLTKAGCCSLKRRS